MKMLQHSNYHRVLRISAVVFALILMFASGIVSQSTAELSHNTGNYVASVIGMSASVEPTELNTLTADLTQRQRELDAREAALRQREIEIGLLDGGVNDKATYVLAGILFILLVLILLNYTLDYLRLKEQQTAQTV